MPLDVSRSVKSEKGVSLKVQEPSPTHVGRNIVTLDRVTKQKLEITSGDIVEIEGTKKTAAIVWPARTEDEGKDIIRMDNLIRHNAGINLGEKVAVRPAVFKEAQKVVLAPIQDVHIIASGYERILKKTFIGRPLTRGDNVWITVFGSGFIYRVVDTNPRGVVKITDFTQFLLKDEPIKGELDGVPRIAYEDVGGLGSQVQKVREMIELPMKHPELFRKLGIEPPKGVLLHGPPGTGKTLLAKAVANETQAHFISVSAPSVMSKFVGEAEEKIRQIFDEAEKNAPAIIFIDEIDAIAPKREEVIGEVERRVVAQILSLMDGMESRGNTIVIAATNRVNSLDEALRRPGRFDREIEIGVPDKKGRKEILEIHTRGMPLGEFVPGNARELAKTMETKLQAEMPKLMDTIQEIEDVESQLKKYGYSIKNLVLWDKKNMLVAKFYDSLDSSDRNYFEQELRSIFLDYFASVTHGFVGADLTALAKEAAMKALRRYLPEINLQINLQEDVIPEEILARMEVLHQDFEDALKEIQPSALREVMVEIPNVKWEDVGSLEDVKAELKQAVEWPLKNPQSFIEMGIRPPRGVLLYGPPGTGKTLLAKAIATETQANFISIKGPELLSKWVGDSEKGIRQIFKKARQVAPVVVFFDEIDAIASIRGASLDSGVSERVVNQLLTELDGAESLKDVVFVAATNRPDLIDPGLLRPGRIDKVIEVKLPDEKAREIILKVHTRGVPLHKMVSLSDLAKRTPGYSGADLSNLVREAALLALQESGMKAVPITKKHFDLVLTKTTASVPQDTQEAYAEYRKSRTPEGFRPNYVR